MVRTNSKSAESCARCGKGEMVTDSTTGERFCGKCGFVVSENSVPLNSIQYSAALAGCYSSMFVPRAFAQVR